MNLLGLHRWVTQRTRILTQKRLLSPHTTLLKSFILKGTVLEHRRTTKVVRTMLMLIILIMQPSSGHTSTYCQQDMSSKPSFKGMDLLGPKLQAQA